MFIKRYGFVFIVCGLLVHHPFINPKPPKLTVVMVIDQFGYKSLQRIRPYLKHGLKFLIDQGVVYHNAIMPHGLPTTAPGHTTLLTGARPEYHGIIANTWLSSDMKEVVVDDDMRYPTFLKQNEGKSPKNIMIKGISDSFVEKSTPKNPYYSVSISGKSRSAICTAGALGKAIWFDKDIGAFTSSAYYFNRLPSWLNAFNKKQDLYHHTNDINWKSAFSLTDKAYGAVLTEGYAFTSPGASFIDKTFHAKHAIKKQHKKNEKTYAYLELTPHINDHIFDCSFTCIKEYLTQKKAGNLLLWVCISSIDKVGHLMGPDSYEVIDSLYHLDNQVGRFMQNVAKIVKKEDTLFVLTADHGVAQIPELAHKKGFLHAKRQQKHELIKEINDSIKQKYGIQDACIEIQAANIYFDQTKIQPKKRFILQAVNKILKAKDYIKNAWTYYELAMLPVQENSIEAFFKNQLFAQRSGDIVYQISPNCLVDDHTTGTSHETPYHDDVHIPLILYQKDTIQDKHISENVFATQLAHTLSVILDVSGPDIGIATEKVLPGIENELIK